ncbi:Hint domain-containing protein [Methylobacterium sp. J-088]|nr:Hint domain-containing protein [Methylobacterium sp. J-088]
MSVERLCVGDLAITADGKLRSIRWIGSRSYSGSTAPKHDCPVRINADALADNVPTRDLLLSPDHALWLDGLFVAAGHLVNGTSITRGEAVADLTYWHVELDSHDLLMAEGTPAESFLAARGVRVGFDGIQALDAGAAPKPYAPRTELGPDLAALRGRLARRAIGAGETGGLSPVRAWLDRCVIGTDGMLHVGGWAHDAAQPATPVCLDVLVDGAVVAFTVANEYRADVATVGVGDGRVGFDLGLDMPLAAGLPHVVEVRRSADGTLVCAKQVDAVGTWTALLAA